MPSKKLDAVEAAAEATVARVRRRLGWAACFIHGFGVIEPGQFTEAITPEEAAHRADFEVVHVPVTTAPDPVVPATATPETEA